jgi:hypothetical protein
MRSNYCKRIYILKKVKRGGLQFKTDLPENLYRLPFACNGEKKRRALFQEKISAIVFPRHRQLKLSMKEYPLQGTGKVYA